MTFAATMSTSATIVTVDRNTRNRELLSNLLQAQGHTPLSVGDLGELQRLLDRDLAIDLALVDISGFGREVWTSLGELNRLGIPFFVVSHRWTPALQQACLARGGLSVLVKPLIPNDLMQLIRNAVR